MKTGILSLALALGLPGMASAQGGVTPLFAADTPLEVTIEGPVNTIARQAERSTAAYSATLRAAGETHAIRLAARGNSRRLRMRCVFPPLAIDFTGKEAETSLFYRQGKIKLVTHCQNRDAFEQQLLREYAAYRLFNVLTPESLKVRLARVRYVDEGREVASRWAFFIEDIDDAARRLGGEEVETGNIEESDLVPTSAARYALFQYMIGNNDWDMTHAPSGEDCCHNSKLVGRDKSARSELTPVPYDFDYSGLVDAPYAVPPESLPLRTVKQRYFRGCTWRRESEGLLGEVRAKRQAMLAELGRIPGLGDRSRRAMEKYLADFFEDLAEPGRTIFRRCD